MFQSEVRKIQMIGILSYIHVVCEIQPLEWFKDTIIGIIR